MPAARKMYVQRADRGGRFGKEVVGHIVKQHRLFGAAGGDREPWA
jgi:hypothetical protein